MFAEKYASHIRVHADDPIEDKFIVRLAEFNSCPSSPAIGVRGQRVLSLPMKCDFDALLKDAFTVNETDARNLQKILCAVAIDGHTESHSR